MTVLDSIIEGVREDLAERRRHVSLGRLEEMIDQAAPAQVPSLSGRDQVSIIAEVKRQSPSKGHLAEIADPAGLAAAYEAGGASAISVLTERRRFGGSLEDLDAVRARVTLPVLRKDFTVDEYQILEARAHGADLVLLIVAALDPVQLADYQDIARELGMTALVETHTEAEVETALNVGADLVGVNARNLKTLEVDMSVFGRLAAEIPDSIVTVAESGVSTVRDVISYFDAGAHAILTGEALVKAGTPTETIAEMISATRKERG